MARTTADLVKAVLAPGLDYDLVRNPSLDPFISMATNLVDRVATCATSAGNPHSTAELLDMETWLAAHFYVQSDQTKASKSTAGASASFHGQTGMRLENSKYGQGALTMDFTGCLGSLSSAVRAGGWWLGKPQNEQIDWDQRN